MSYGSSKYLCSSIFLSSFDLDNQYELGFFEKIMKNFVIWIFFMWEYRFYWDPSLRARNNSKRRFSAMPVVCSAILERRLWARTALFLPVEPTSPLK